MALPSEFPRHRFDSADVVRLVEAGILRETDRVELIEGELIVTPPQGPEHASIANELDDLLRKAYSDDFRVRASLPLTLGEQTDPEPDVAVVLGAVAAFRQRHPRGDEAVLAIEVAQTSRVARKRSRATREAASPCIGSSTCRREPSRFTRSLLPQSSAIGPSRSSEATTRSHFRASNRHGVCAICSLESERVACRQPVLLTAAIRIYPRD